MSDTTQNNAMIAANNPTRIAEPIAPPPEWEAAKGQVESMGRALYESPTFTGAVKNKDEMLKQLFEFDQNTEKQYTSPTQSQAQSMYGPDYVPYPMTAITGSAGYASGLGSATGATQGAIGNISGYYESAMTNVLSQILGWMEMAEKRKQREADAKAKERANMLDILKIAGGVDPETGIRIPSQMEIAAAGRSGSGTAQERSHNTAYEAMKREVSQNAPYYDLVPRYAGILEPYEIRQEYNKGPLAKKYGGATETGEWDKSQQYKDTTGDNGEAADPTKIDPVFDSMKQAVMTENPELDDYAFNQEAKKRVIAFSLENYPEEAEKVKKYLDIKFPEKQSNGEDIPRVDFSKLLQSVAKGTPVYQAREALGMEGS